jgi:hypothetical protein
MRSCGSVEYASSSRRSAGLLVVSIAIRMIMARLPVFFVFTAVQRPELPILAVPFRQICAARQGLAVIPAMVIAVSLIVDPHPDAGTAGRPGERSGQQDRSRVYWGRDLGDLFRREQRPAVVKV